EISEYKLYRQTKGFYAFLAGEYSSAFAEVIKNTRTGSQGSCYQRSLLFTLRILWGVEGFPFRSWTSRVANQGSFLVLNILNCPDTDLKTQYMEASYFASRPAIKKRRGDQSSPPSFTRVSW